MFIQPDMTLNDIAQVIHDFKSPEPFVETRVIATGRGTRLIFSSEKTGLDFQAEITVLEDKDPTGAKCSRNCLALPKMIRSMSHKNEPAASRARCRHCTRWSDDNFFVEHFENLVEGVDITVTEADETKSSEFSISKDIGLLTNPRQVLSMLTMVWLRWSMNPLILMYKR